MQSTVETLLESIVPSRRLNWRDGFRGTSWTLYARVDSNRLRDLTVNIIKVHPRIRPFWPHLQESRQFGKVILANSIDQLV